MRVEDFEKEFDKQVKNIQKPNIMIIGGTGVGKSSLINEIFGEELAKTGSGAPITKGCNEYSKENIGVVIFDTEGYEIEPNGNINNSNFTNIVLKEVNRRTTLELKDHIHLFWYCISIANHRITEYDIKNIKELHKISTNLSIILTKCDSDELDAQNNGVRAAKFKKILREEGVDNPVFETMIGDDEKLDLDKLIEWSSENLPNDQLREQFIGTQKKNIPLKEKTAKQIITTASAAAAFAAGANPIPLSDSLLLTPIQISMAVSLSKTYGFGVLGLSVTNLLQAQIMSMLGKQLASSLLKLIPGVGQVINAGVATGLTAGLGFGLNELYKSAYISFLENGKEPEWKKLFETFNFTEIIKAHMKK